MPKQNKAKRSLPKMPPEVKEAYRQLQTGVKGLGKSIAEIQRDLRKAERKIEADARARITELRHYPLISRRQEKLLTKRDKFERKAAKLVEYPRPKPPA